MIQDSAPPPKKAVPAPKPKAPSAKAKEREEAVAGLGQLAQVPLLAVKLYADAGALGLYWPGIAKEVSVLAESQESIANVIDPLIKVGPYAALITSVLPLLIQVAVNHGRIPAGAMGTVPASMLAAQVETSLAQAELDALRVQAEAERQAANMRAQITEQREQAMAAAGD